MENLDESIILYPKVLSNVNLTTLQKIIFCDVINSQNKGETYLKTSSKVGKEFGGYSKKTIQTAFQELTRNGYLTCNLSENEYGFIVREAKVNNLKKWI